MTRGSRLATGLWLAGALLLGGCATGRTKEPSPEKELQYGARMARLGYWQEARFRFQLAIAAQPNNARAHNDLAVAFEANGDFPAAFEEYKKAVSLDSADKNIRQNYTRFAEFYTAYTKKVGKVSSAP
ncbi:MAG TPA: tetratricopeptide repeat protein [Thermoanaerobaculia bacterium]|nr:tetratricopeptide repeat protein [Thermoanaerobaculia bacterium]